jgi:ubiquinone/menaquinone biosynthesis C-methylase UbiE
MVRRFVRAVMAASLLACRTRARPRMDGDAMVYDESMAASYDRGRRLRTPDSDGWMSAARPYLPGVGGRVLDLGAGTGRFSAALARASGATIVACEPSAAMRAACAATHPHLLIVAGTAQEAPFQAGSFHAVWASQVIHHVPDLPAFAATMRRILTPAGHLLLRGGFGRVEELLLHQYFPDAWSNSAMPPLSAITQTLGGVGMEPVAHVKVRQVIAADAEELIGKVRSRTLSNLASLPDAAFDAGLRALQQDAATGAIPYPVAEHLHLAVFRTRST